MNQVKRWLVRRSEEVVGSEAVKMGESCERKYARTLVRSFLKTFVHTTVAQHYHSKICKFSRGKEKNGKKRKIQAIKIGKNEKK